MTLDFGYFLARGKAVDDDATYLTVAAKSALSRDSIGAVLHRGWYAQVDPIPAQYPVDP